MRQIHDEVTNHLTGICRYMRCWVKMSDRMWLLIGYMMMHIYNVVIFILFLSFTFWLYSIIQINYYAMLYYTMLYYAMLSYTIPYYAILCYAVLYYAILCYAVLYYAILCYTILYHTILYYTMLYYAMLSYTIQYTLVYHTMLYYNSIDRTYRTNYISNITTSKYYLSKVILFLLWVYLQ